MKFFNNMFKQQKRAFQASHISRLNGDWSVYQGSPNMEIGGNVIENLRNRSRNLAQNNDYVARYLSLLSTNVIGPGIKLQVQSVDSNGQLDTSANQAIEKMWNDWQKDCDVSRQLSFVDIQQLLLKTIARDGEVLVRKVKGFSNKFSFALQIIEPDMLDHKFNASLKNGNVVRMGVEQGSYGEPIAYHILSSHPSENMNANRIRVPADEIIHLFKQDRAGQVRGVSWLSPVMERLNMLGKYEEAELVAARVGASKMGFITTPDGGGYTGDDAMLPGSLKADPGTFEQLAAGEDFKEWNPTHPNSGFSQFSTSILRGVASGLNVSYHSLSSDLSSTSYSSARVGLIEERDYYRTVQNWFIERFMTDIYKEWLSIALTLEMSNLPLRKIGKFEQHAFKARGWQFINPEKEIAANIKAVGAGLKSAQEVAIESGREITEIYQQLAEEKKLREKLGITTEGDLE